MHLSVAGFTTMNFKNSLLVIVILAAAVGGFFLLRSSPQNHRQMQNSSIADKVLALQLEDYNGSNIPLSDFKGRPLVINSWAAWCPFCRKELVDFAAAQKEFGDKVTIIAVDRAETRETAKKYTDEIGVTEDMIFLLDPRDIFYQSIGGFSMPETIFIDKSGAVSIHERGPMDLEEMRQKIQQLISQ